jgi:hypothetical protein
MRKAARAKATQAPQATPVAPPAALAVAPKGKIGLLVTMLREGDGTTIAAMMAATGWQAHSVRGALSGSVRKVLGLHVVSEKGEAGRIYRIIEAEAA